MLESSQGITQDCAMLWRTIAKDGGWWSVLRLTREWSPTYSLTEVEEHLVTLRKGGFLEGQLHSHSGTVYAFTARCQRLPGGDSLVRAGVSGDRYTPPQITHRPGALDHLRYPSLQPGALA